VSACSSIAAVRAKLSARARRSTRGHVQRGELSIFYGRVFPPHDAADADRVPGFVGVLDRKGPSGYATNVTIAENRRRAGRPRTITIRAPGTRTEPTATFAVESAIMTPAGGLLMSGPDFSSDARHVYRERSRRRPRALEFIAPGSAETFRGAARK
jgi:hypothetical protein